MSSLKNRAVLAGVILLAAVAACRREPAVSGETHRQAVVAFYVSLAAMQTSQDALARKELERLIQIAPDEPAGHANLGLLLLRQQQFDEAAARFTRALELAPRDAAMARMAALVETRRGNSDEAIRRWRRAMELDAADNKAPYALAQELERAGGAQNEAEAQRLFESVATRGGNLAAALEYARLAAKRGDAASLGKALDALTAASRSWPADAQARLKAVRDAAAQNAAGATTSVIFLKNVLIREPEYQAALGAVSAPRSEIGEPLVRLVTLANPEPQPAAIDEHLTFTPDPAAAIALPETAWAGVVALTGDGQPAIAAAAPRTLRLASGAAINPTGKSAFSNSDPDAIAAVDFDSDFRTDLVVAADGGLQLFKQSENGAFAAVSGLEKTGSPGEAIRGVWPADFDTDGDLDLVLGNREGPVRVLQNNGDGTFRSLTPFGNASRLRAFVWADLDGEGVPDAALVDEQGLMRIFLNMRSGQFRERAVPTSVPRFAAIAPADISGDGMFDIVGASGDGSLTSVSFNARGGFEAVRITQIDPLPTLSPGNARLLVADLDNNGAGDFIVSGPSTTRVVMRGPGGSYRPASGGIPGGVLSAADLDGDGRLELVARASDGARVIRVKGSKAYHWQALRPRAVSATGDQRINSFGIGGEIEVRTGLHVQKQPIVSPLVHFGLGEAATSEVARVIWPNGVIQSEFGLAVDAAVGASQRLKGSCPWLFAWNGKEIAFVTDWIWRSALGLKINAETTAEANMTEEWIKIRGEQLAARNGEYDLRVTAELWETHFYDWISLMAVDHPAGTEIFVDERFAVPPPKLAVIATGPVQDFTGARDDGGRDVLDIVRTRDDRHLDNFGRGRFQGVTRDHYVELDLPDSAPRTGPLWLVAQGWVHPTDTSINVAIGQGRHERPSSLSLLVGQSNGTFKVAQAGLGFPAGKDKTVLIDLTGVLPRVGPRRVRLQTNLEVFWDRLAWAVGRPEVKLNPVKLDLRTASLDYRGYSATYQKDASTPERPRYETIDGTAPRWRDLEGFYTRFGDVRELLTGVDDRYVIMNAGDEMRFSFAEAPPPAAGLVRDFVLIGDGWIKDGDYNTVASRTVSPLPTHTNPKYVPGTGREEDDAVYQRQRADFERYHTRWISSAPFRDALRATMEKR